jgi:hypothetical protein
MSASLSMTIKKFDNMKKNRLNMNPKIWGKHGWPFLYSIVFGYPKNPTDEEKQRVKLIFINLIIALACLKCRFNYKKHLQETPLTDEIMNSRTELMKWLIDINNAVNKSLGQQTYNYDETINYYYNLLKGTDNIFCSNTIIIILIIILLIFILLKLYKKKSSA